MQGLEWGDSGRGGGDFHVWFDGSGWNNDAPQNLTAPNGSGANSAGKGFTYTTGTAGAATAAGGDYTVNLGSEAGVARAGRLIVNRTSVQTDGGSYNGAVTINETITPASTVTGSTQALNLEYVMNGDGTAYTSAGGNAGISAIESQFFCNLTGTMSTLLYGAEFQFIMQGTGSANATVVQADMYGLAASPGTYSSIVGYRAILGPLNGVTATVATAFISQSGGFATQNSITATNTLTVRNFMADILVGSPSGTDTAGAYKIYCFTSGVPSQGGNTTGTNDNSGVRIVVTTPNSTGGVPGVNGTVNNTAGWFGVPTAGGPGSGTGRTINCGILINGNGNAGTQGAGFANDWALFSNSTAPSGLVGGLYLGGPGSVNPPSVNSMLTVLASRTIASSAGATWHGGSFTAATATVSGSTNITTAGGFNLFTIAAPTISAASALTVTNAATLAITGPPVGAGAGPATLTNSPTLWVASNVATVAAGSPNAAISIGTSGTAPLMGIYWGSGAPTITAPQGSLYFRTDGSSTSTRLYVNTTGSTTWTNVVTAA